MFQDFGIPNAEEHLLKAQLVFKTRARDAKYLMDRAINHAD